VSLLKLQITMSLDGYVAGPRQSVENPLGERGGQLHKWAVATRSFRQMHGMEDGGETGGDDDVVAGLFRNIGAVIMGRHMFGGGDGPWGADPWRGWWGENPPYHSPVFVLTHHAREPLEMEGGTTFHFVTDGIHAALDRARDAAQGKDISLAGGAQAVQQYLKEGLIDEMEIHVAPVLLGDGERLFENTGGRQADFECVRIAASDRVCHYSYRRV
jgi:dihydrofolate reductase